MKSVKADIKGMLNILIDMIEDINDFPCSSNTEFLDGCLLDFIHNFKTLSKLEDMHKETNHKMPLQYTDRCFGI